MSKLFIGVAIGYLLSDIIDEFLGKNAPAKPKLKDEAPSDVPGPEPLT